jgi:hypothetical protein
MKKRGKNNKRLFQKENGRRLNFSNSCSQKMLKRLLENVDPLLNNLIHNIMQI